MPRIFTVPFAETGDKISPPNPTQPDGTVSYSQGFGFDYQRKTDGTDPLAKVFPREQFNGIINDITGAVGEIQLDGFATWQEAGRPYKINAMVRYADQAWRSTVTNNNTTPGAVGSSWSVLGNDYVLIQATESELGGVKIAQAGAASVGTDDTTAITPKKFADAIATESSKGVVRIATQAQVTTGADDATAVTPKKLAARVATEALSGIAPIATTAQVSAGTNNSAIVTPAKLAAALPQRVSQCTAWVSFVGTGTVSIRAAYNVSSITDNGIGDYTVNFASPMTSNNYAFSGSVRFVGSGALSGAVSARDADIMSASALQVRTVALGGNNTLVADVTTCNVLVFGGK